ncbi:MAG: Crp/Fnr family transcriptional regulator [Acidimicrobiia bacterium]|nr:Crp/Fnr family transcriptional regulator [Acidimicrobiia bacterium]
MTGRTTAATPTLDAVDQQHLAWIARSFGRADYLPLTPDDVGLLVRVGDSVSKYPGTHLFKEGEEARHAYLLQSGSIDLYRTSDGTKRIVARVGPGSVLGDIAMFGRGRYISSAQAVGRVTAYRLDRDRLLPELANHPAICMRWLVAGLRQLEETQRRVLHLMRKTVLAQVADLVLEEGRTSGTVQLSQASIATLLGVSRQTVNESIARLKELGAVETGYRSITVVEQPVLADVAAERLS